MKFIKIRPAFTNLDESVYILFLESVKRSRNEDSLRVSGNAETRQSPKWPLFPLLSAMPSPSYQLPAISLLSFLEEVQESAQHAW